MCNVNLINTIEWWWGSLHKYPKYFPHKLYTHSVYTLYCSVMSFIIHLVCVYVHYHLGMLHLHWQHPKQLGGVWRWPVLPTFFPQKTNGLVHLTVDLISTIKAQFELSWPTGNNMKDLWHISKWDFTSGCIFPIPSIFTAYL